MNPMQVSSLNEIQFKENFESSHAKLKPLGLWNKTEVVRLESALNQLTQKVKDVLTGSELLPGMANTTQLPIAELEAAVHSIQVHVQEGPEQQVAYPEIERVVQKQLLFLSDAMAAAGLVSSNSLGAKMSSQLHLAADHIAEHLNAEKPANLGEGEPAQKASESKNVKVNLMDLKNNRTFLNKYTQVQVLNQQTDLTHHGIENCGFHALKNAIALLAANQNEEGVDFLLEDPQVFLSFYKRYCEPLLAGKTPKDASIPMLHDLIQAIQNDPNPPENLAILQKALRQTKVDIAILSTSSDSGEVLKGFLGEKGIKDAEKFYAFSTQPGPKDIVLIFGNQDEGHWMTIYVHKNEDGSLHYFGCDSMGEDHQLSGEFSQFAKIASSIERGIQHPHEAVLAALEDTGENLARKAGWIGSESEAMLLDNTPNPLLAKGEGSAGSNQEMILNETMLMYQTLTNLGSLESSDMSVQINISNIQSLLQFYTEKLDHGHPLFNECNRILSEIKNMRGDSYFRERLEQILKEINGKAQTLNAPEKQAFLRTRELAEWMIELDKGKKAIASDEQFRQKMMAKYSIEHDFSRNPITDIERNIIVFLQAYQLASKQEKLQDFCNVVSKPACFTGRMAGVEDYLPRLKWPEMDALALAGYLYMLPDVVVSDYILEISPLEEAREFILDITIEEFNKPEAQATLSHTFRRFGSAETAKPFIDFLHKEGFSDTCDPKLLDWEKVVPKLVASKYFKEMFSRGKAEALKQEAF